MSLGTSIFLLALGAILRFAVHVTTRGFNLHTVGLILMLAGILGIILSVLWMTIWADRRRRAAYVVRDREVPARTVDRY